MSPDRFGNQLDDQVGQAQARLRRQQEQLSTATEAAATEATTYEADGGDIRVTVSGRMRIDDLYVSERTLRAEDAEQRLVQAVNAALAAAASAQAERVAAGLDLETANILAAADEFATDSYGNGARDDDARSSAGGTGR